jgi:hypothetical protein
MVVAILIFSIIGRPALYFMILERLALIPVIAGISYEATYFGARHSDNPLVRAILSPGLLLQKLTTREPDEQQIEVAIAALKRVIEIDVPIITPVLREQLPDTLIPDTADSKDI